MRITVGSQTTGMVKLSHVEDPEAWWRRVVAWWLRRTLRQERRREQVTSLRDFAAEVAQLQCVHLPPSAAHNPPPDQLLCKKARTAVSQDTADSQDRSGSSSTRPSTEDKKGIPQSSGGSPSQPAPVDRNSPDYVEELVIWDGRLWS